MDKALIKINELKKNIEKIEEEIIELNKEKEFVDSKNTEFSIKYDIDYRKERLNQLKKINLRKILVPLSIVVGVVSFYFCFDISIAYISRLLLCVLSSIAVLGGVQIPFLIKDIRIVNNNGIEHLKEDIKKDENKLEELATYKKTKNRTMSEVLEDIKSKELEKKSMISRIKKLEELRDTEIKNFIIENKELDLRINQKYENNINEEQEIESKKIRSRTTIWRKKI